MTRWTLRLREVPAAATMLATAYVVNAAVAAGVHAAAIGRPLAIAAVGAAAVTLAAVAVTRSRDRGGLLAVVILATVVAGGAVGTVLTRTAWWQAALWSLLLVVAAALAIRIVRRRRSGTIVPRSSTLNLLAGILLVVVVGSAVVSGRAGALAADLTPTQPATASSTEPDIVVVLLDGYPRADTLQRLFAFDNGPFLGDLEALGFEVADRATSNYAWTELTLLSMLHMQPAQDIPAFTDRAAAGGASQPWLRQLISDNAAFDLAREEGYKVVTIAPGIDHVVLRGADEVLTPPGLSDFEILLLTSTALAGTLATVDSAFFARDQRDQVLWSLEQIEEVATSDPGGRLVIGHVMSPHLPAVFNADGSLRVDRFDSTYYLDFRALTDRSREQWNAAFRAQVEHLNRLVLRMVESIVEANPRAAIVLMSDHGSGSQFRADTLDTDIEERFSTLFAARTPGEPNPFEEHQTPVNVFSTLFSTRFGLEIPHQPDSAYAGYLEFTRLPDVGR